jgi:rod shape-determining protein MreC
MGPFSRVSRARLILALLVLTAVTLMTLDTRGTGPVATVRDSLLSVLTPFRSAAEWVTDPVGDVWNGIVHFDDLEEENAELRAQLDQVRGDEVREITDREVLEQLLAATEITFADDIEQVAARVVAGPSSSFEETVTIDKGSDHGITEGMAVVTGAGFVGRIERVTSNRSIVLLLSDAGMTVSARLVTTQGLGRVDGRGSQRPPVVELLADEGAVAGEILQTSGLEGSLYPPGIPIGRIVSIPGSDGDDADVEEEDDDTTATTTGGSTVIPDLAPVGTVRAEIEPFATLDRLNFVTVLVWSPQS